MGYITRLFCFHVCGIFLAVSMLLTPNFAMAAMGKVTAAPWALQFDLQAKGFTGLETLQHEQQYVNELSAPEDSTNLDRRILDISSTTVRALGNGNGIANVVFMYTFTASAALAKANVSPSNYDANNIRLQGILDDGSDKDFIHITVLQNAEELATLETPKAWITDSNNKSMYSQTFKEGEEYTLYFTTKNLLSKPISPSGFDDQDLGLVETKLITGIYAYELQVNVAPQRYQAPASASIGTTDIIMTPALRPTVDFPVDPPNAVWKDKLALAHKATNIPPNEVVTFQQNFVVPAELNGKELSKIQLQNMNDGSLYTLVADKAAATSSVGGQYWIDDDWPSTLNISTVTVGQKFTIYYTIKANGTEIPNTATRIIYDATFDSKDAYLAPETLQKDISMQNTNAYDLIKVIKDDFTSYTMPSYNRTFTPISVTTTNLPMRNGFVIYQQKFTGAVFSTFNTYSGTLVPFSLIIRQTSNGPVNIATRYKRLTTIPNEANLETGTYWIVNVKSPSYAIPQLSGLDGLFDEGEEYAIYYVVKDAVDGIPSSTGVDATLFDMNGAGSAITNTTAMQTHRAADEPYDIDFNSNNNQPGIDYAVGGAVRGFGGFSNPLEKEIYDARFNSGEYYSVAPTHITYHPVATRFVGSSDAALHNKTIILRTSFVYRGKKVPFEASQIGLTYLEPDNNREFTFVDAMPPDADFQRVGSAASRANGKFWVSLARDYGVNEPTPLITKGPLQDMLVPDQAYTVHFAIDDDGVFDVRRRGFINGGDDFGGFETAVRVRTGVGEVGSNRNRSGGGCTVSTSASYELALLLLALVGLVGLRAMRRKM